MTPDTEIYVIEDDFDSLGRSGLIDFNKCSKADCLDWLLEANNPLRVYRFNPSEGTSADVSEDIAEAWWALLKPDWEHSDTLPDFIETHMTDASHIAAHWLHERDMATIEEVG